MRRERGTATVEAVALSLLVAALLGVVIAEAASSPPITAARSLGSELARRLRCAPAEPGPCWRDPLTLAYGRPLAGALRALAPAPTTARASDGLAVAPIDFRYCRHSTCAVPSSKPGLSTSNRRMTAFTSIADHRRSDGFATLTYWLYRPTLGWSRVERTVTSAEIDALATTPLPDSDIPRLVPLETLPGRDSFQFSAAEEPPWRGLIVSRYPG